MHSDENHERKRCDSAPESCSLVLRSSSSGLRVQFQDKYQLARMRHSSTTNSNFECAPHRPTLENSSDRAFRILAKPPKALALSMFIASSSVIVIVPGRVRKVDKQSLRNWKRIGFLISRDPFYTKQSCRRYPLGPEHNTFITRDTALNRRVPNALRAHQRIATDHKC